MVSKVSICNMALRRVGEQTISALDDGSKNANICNDFFEDVLQQVLRAHPWNFALARTELALSATAPAYGWDNQYLLPADCLRVLRMEDFKTVFVVESDYLLTDNTEAKILYIKYLTDMTLLDPLAVKVLYLSLGVEFSYNLTENNTILGGLMQQLEQAWRDARCMDAQEGTPMVSDNSDWVNARYSGKGFSILGNKVK